jgi:hypothetical protein
VKHAIETVAASFGWDRMTIYDLGLLLWALFRYYAWRQADDISARRNASANG